MGFPPQQPRCPSATVPSLQRPSPFCHPERSEGSAVPRTRLGNVSLQRVANGEVRGGFSPSGRLVVCGSFAADRGLVFPGLLRR
jgi:hypothetical protein